MVDIELQQREDELFAECLAQVPDHLLRDAMAAGQQVADMRAWIETQRAERERLSKIIAEGPATIDDLPGWYDAQLVLARLEAGWPWHNRFLNAAIVRHRDALVPARSAMRVYWVERFYGPAGDRVHQERLNGTSATYQAAQRELVVVDRVGSRIGSWS